MQFKNLIIQSAFTQDKKLMERLVNFETLINEVQKKNPPVEIVNLINQEIEEMNSFSGSNAEFLKQFKRKQMRILKVLEKELKLVPKNHYATLWLALGMSAFGVPIGVAFGLIMHNMALLGVGLPIGLAIGAGVGAAMDKKAKETEKQLDVEIK